MTAMDTATLQPARLVARATIRGEVCPEHPHERLRTGHLFHRCPLGHRVDRALNRERRLP